MAMGTKFAVLGCKLEVAHKEIFKLLPQVYPQDFVIFYHKTALDF